MLPGKVALSDGSIRRGTTRISANELLHKVVDHELRADKEDQSRWMYKSTTRKSGRVVTKEVIETKQGDLDRLLSINGKAINEEQQKSENERVQKILADPDELQKLQKNQQNDSDQSEHLLAVLPKAMIASYGRRRDGLIELNLNPNPKYHPTSHETEVFHAMAGQLWVNSKEDRLAVIDGHLIKRVEFWHGLLGHLEKGGEFHVTQSEVQPGHWEITALHINMRGKALFFKNIGVQENERRSDFERVMDDLTIAQAAEKLEPRAEAAQR
jgi:Tfp pilus assembly protein PilN